MGTPVKVIKIVALDANVLKILIELNSLDMLNTYLLSDTI